MKRLSLVTALLGSLLPAGCGGGGAAVEERPVAAEADAASPRERKPDEKASGDWGTLKGRVVWKGASPEIKPLVVDKDQAQCLKNGPVPNEEFVINKTNKGVRFVIVWLTGGGDPKKPAALPVHPDVKEIKEKEFVVDQPCCKFEPRVFALRQGQILVAKNSSPTLHNFNWQGGEGEGNNTTVPANDEIKITVEKASQRPFLVSCGIHPWMKGAFRVFDHPYFAVTDADGKFEIKKVPAGKCQLVVWHEGVGWGEGGRGGQAVDVKAGGTTDVDTALVK